ncbi:hypothetical protein EDD21DRAFT_349324 [Dissophora ornata]|nr:hypothetical protein BGZ58_007230 [Dissophora ornata]KAI8606164.1 hypothetical protein EDD21DRAFT_349324 [Dissophora ornata]
MNGSNNTPGVKGSVERPPSTIQTSKIMPVATPAPDVSENVKSIEQVIADIDPDIKKSQSSTRASETLEPSFSSDPTSSESSSSTAPPESESGSSSSARPKRPSRTWFYLYQILYWCTVGSIPVHLLLIKSETKEVREKQEWKIAVLTDMRDKLKRGDSVEEEEALLSVGMDRSEREEQVDDKYFEDLLTSAEKLDFTFGDKDRANTELEIALSTPVVSTPTPASPAVPRKPAPPKSEKSYL